MKLKALRDRVRQLLDDELTPYLWSDAELNYNINDALREAIIRARLLASGRSDFDIPLVIGQADYDLDPNILDVHTVRLSGEDFDLRKVSLRERYRRGLGVGQNDTGDKPSQYALDGFAGGGGVRTLTVLPTPSATGTLVIDATYLPFDTLSSDSDTPCIADFYHADLVYWAVSQSYLKHDSQTENLEKSQFYEEKFTRLFGERLPAEWLYDRQNRSDLVVIPD